MVSHVLDPDRSVTVGDDDCKDSVDLTFNVTCITLEVSLDIALTHGFPNTDLISVMMLENYQYAWMVQPFGLTLSY
jgi:hypothetical protein